MIAESRAYQVGPFTIQERPRPDNPAWPVYIVLLGLRVVGKGFSKPSISDCEWMAGQKGETVYADPAPAKPYGFTAVHKARAKLLQAAAALEEEAADSPA